MVGILKSSYRYTKFGLSFLLIPVFCEFMIIALMIKLGKSNLIDSTSVDKFLSLFINNEFLKYIHNHWALAILIWSALIYFVITNITKIFSFFAILKQSLTGDPEVNVKNGMLSKEPSNIFINHFRIYREHGQSISDNQYFMHGIDSKLNNILASMIYFIKNKSVRLGKQHGFICGIQTLLFKAFTITFSVLFIIDFTQLISKSTKIAAEALELNERSLMSCHIFPKFALKSKALTMTIGIIGLILITCFLINSIIDIVNTIKIHKNLDTIYHMSTSNILINRIEDIVLKATNVYIISPFLKFIDTKCGANLSI